MAKEAMKFGYGNLSNIDSAIESGKIDERDLVLTKDTSELFISKMINQNRLSDQEF